MITIIQYCDTEGLWPRYFTTTKEVSHLNKHIVNSVDSGAVQDEIAALLFDEETGDFKLNEITLEQVFNTKNAKIIQIGFYS